MEERQNSKKLDKCPICGSSVIREAWWFWGNEVPKNEYFCNDCGEYVFLHDELLVNAKATFLNEIVSFVKNTIKRNDDSLDKVEIENSKN